MLNVALNFIQIYFHLFTLFWVNVQISLKFILII